jgi:peptide/nickel transport system substrate-binding protein
LYKNANYYGKDKDGNSLPYIDSLIFDILATSEDALDKFEHGNIDFINYVPSSQVSRIVSENIQSFKNPPKFLLNQNAEMINSYYLFNTHKAPFNNVKLRQAINYAIDRNKLVDVVLLGQAFGSANHGVVPPTFDFYKTSALKGYAFDVEKAKTLLKEAGYPNAKGLPEIQLIINSGRSRNSSVAAEIQKQLKTNLGINITFETVTGAEKIMMETNEKGEIYNSGWAADYPSPESFLSVFYSNQLPEMAGTPLYPNSTNYRNKDFDKFYELGRDASSKDSAAAYFLKAEQILINDAPMIPLWYEGTCRLIKYRIKNFYSNPLGYFDFSQVKVSDK